METSTRAAAQRPLATNSLRSPLKAWVGRHLKSLWLCKRARSRPSRHTRSRPGRSQGFHPGSNACKVAITASEAAVVCRPSVSTGFSLSVRVQAFLKAEAPRLQVPSLERLVVLLGRITPAPMTLSIRAITGWRLAPERSFVGQRRARVTDRLPAPRRSSADGHRLGHVVPASNHSVALPHRTDAPSCLNRLPSGPRASRIPFTFPEAHTPRFLHQTSASAFQHSRDTRSRSHRAEAGSQPDSNAAGRRSQPRHHRTHLRSTERKHVSRAPLTRTPSTGGENDLSRCRPTTACTGLASLAGEAIG